MTKTIKKSLTTVLLFFMAVAFVFGATYASAFAEMTNDEQKFVDSVAIVYDAADADDSGTLEEAETLATMSDESVVSAFLLAKAHFDNYKNDNSEDSNYQDAVTKYIEINSFYNVAAELYGDIVYTARQAATSTGASYNDNEKIVSIRTRYDAARTAGDSTYSFILNSSIAMTVEDTDKPVPELLVKAEARMEAFRLAIENAINAIKAVEIFDGTMTPVYESSAYKSFADDNVVIDSLAKIEVAEGLVSAVNALDKAAFIDGEKEFGGETLNHGEKLVALRTSVNKQIAKVTAIVAKIQTAWTAYDNGKNIFTIKDKIEAAGVNGYDTLPTDTNNNLQAYLDAKFPTDKANLVTMRNALAQEQLDVNEVLGLIAAIGEVKYNRTTLNAIATARNAFNGENTKLGLDLRNHDIAEAESNGTDFMLKNSSVNYGTLLQAEKDWDALVLEVETLINSIKGLRAIETDELKAEDTVKEFIKTMALYTSLSDKNNQLVGDVTADPDDVDIIGVNGALLDEPFQPEDSIVEITTCKDAYEYYSDLTQKIQMATRQIDLDIQDLLTKDITFTDTFNSLYVKIVDAINGLPKKNGNPDPRYLGAIANYKKPDARDFLEVQADYLALLDVAADWIEATKKVGTVSVNNFEDVLAAFDKFDDLKTAYTLDKDGNPTTAYDLRAHLAAFTRVYTGEDEVSDTFANYYATYAQVEEDYEELIDAMDLVKTGADALDRPTNIDSIEFATYAGLVADVTTNWNALVDYDNVVAEGDLTTQEYFALENGDYYTAYVNYVAGLVNVEAHKIELEIAEIFTDSTANTNHIADARAKYDDYTAPQDALYEKEDVQAAVRNYEVTGETNTLVAVETKLQDWEDAVEALLTNAGFNGNAATVVDSSIVINGTTVKEGFFKLDIDADYRALQALVLGFTNVEKAYVYGTYKTADAIELLAEIHAVAGGDKDDHGVITHQGTKLAYIDDQLYIFCEAYDIGSTTPGAYEELDEILGELTLSQIEYLENANRFQQIARDKEMATLLASAIDTLYENVNSSVAAEDAVEYYTIASIYATLNASQKALVITENGNGNPETVLAAIKAKVGNVTFDYNDILDRLEALEATYSDADIDDAIEAAIEEAVATLQAQINDLKDVKVPALEQAIEDIQDAISAVKGDLVDGDYASIKALSDAVKNLEDALEEAVAELEGKIEDLEGMIEDLEDKDAAIEAAISAIKGALVDGDYKSIKELSDAIKSLDEAYKTADAALQEAINAEITAREEAIKAEAAARDEAIKALQAELEAQIKSAKTIAVIALVISIICLAGAVWFVLDKFVFNK